MRTSSIRQAWRERRAGFRPTLELLDTRCVPAVISEFPLLTGAPTPVDIARGPDGSLFYTDPGANKIGRVAVTGAVVEYALPTAASDPRGIAAGPDGNVWFTAFGTDRIGVLNPATGGVTEFQLTLGSAPTGITAGPDGRLWFAAAGTDEIGAITTAGVVSTFAVPGPGSTPFGITSGPDGNLWFTEVGSGEIGVISPAGVVLNEFTSGAITAPSAGITTGPDGNLWYGSTVGSFIGQLTPAGVNTVFTGFGNANTSTPDIVAGPDGALWFTEGDGDQIGRIDTTGVVTGEFPTNPGDRPNGIAVGGDGALWFAQTGGSSVGRSTTAGVVTDVRLRASTGPTAVETNGYFTEPDAGKIGRRDPATGAVIEYTLSNSLSDLRGVVTGPDGAVWFTEFGTDRIGRLDPATGAITEFALTPGAGPIGITVGPDGRLWFTEAGADAVGAITTAGVVTEFPGLGAGSTPFGIAAGADGRLWFTQLGSDEIGAITTAGVLTEYPVAGPGSAPFGITPAPGGAPALWFTESGSDEVAVITTAGVVTEFALPAGAAPAGITTGADGALWFTEPGIDAIGRVTRTGTITQFVTGITPGAGLAGIATDPAGNLTIAETTAARVGVVVLSADLSVTKTDGQTTAVPGATVTYTIVVTNPAGGDDVEQVTVTDAFLPVLTGVTWTAVFAGGASGTAAGAGDINQVVAIPAGGTVTYTVTGTVSSAVTGTLTNTASVSSGITDPTPGDNTATDTDVLLPTADVRVTVAASPAGSVIRGGTLTYTIVVTNTGPSDTTARLTDVFPPGLTGVTYTATAVGTTATAPGTGNLDLTLVLPAGASVTVTATGTVSATSGTLTNTATAANTGAVELTPADNSAATTSTIGGVPTGFAGGTDAGRPPLVRTYTTGGALVSSTTAFASSFLGGVRVASADFNGDGVVDLVVGTGPGIATAVRVLDGATQAELFTVAPFESSFTGGVFVAAGDVDGDGVPELVVTPDQGGGPRVQVYRGAGFAKIADFLGIDDANFRGGARAAVGDVDGDGFADLVVAAGFGGGPRVATFDGGELAAGRQTRLFGDFFIFGGADAQTLRNGAFIAAGDVNGDGFADLIGGGGPGGAPRVLVVSGQALVVGGSGNAVPLANFFAGSSDSRGGVRVASKNLDGDGFADVLVGAGVLDTGRVTAYAGAGLSPTSTPAPILDFTAFDGPAGVFVG